MSSKRNKRRRTCTTKYRHASSKAAGYAIRLLHESGRAKGPMNIYKCKFCNGYHIGKSSRMQLEMRGF